MKNNIRSEILRLAITGIKSFTHEGCTISLWKEPVENNLPVYWVDICTPEGYVDTFSTDDINELLDTVSDYFKVR